MPKIQWENLPREKWAHLRDRAKERKVSMEDLFELASWKSQDPDVPDGDWYKDFGTFKLCGERVWGLEGDTLSRTVDVHIAGLRKKIEEDSRYPRFLITVKGSGYKLAV